MKSPTSKAIITLAACQLLSGNAFALTPFSDNFKAASLNTSRWSLHNYAKGKLTQSSGRINFTVATPPTNDDFATLDLRNNQPGYNESWQVVLDVANTTKSGFRAGVGIGIFNADDYGDGVFLEFYGAAADGGFNIIAVTNDNDNPAGDILKNPRITSGSIRISFDKTSKLFTFWYDKTGSADGFKWVKMGTFSPTGKGGDRRGNWNMNSGGGRFAVQIFGYAQKQSVASGKISMDNFILKAK